MLPRCRTLLGLSELPTNDDPLSLSLNLSLLLSFLQSGESQVLCRFLKKAEEKEKKKNRECKKLSFKKQHNKKKRESF